MFTYPEVSVGDRVLFYDNPYDASSVSQVSFCVPLRKNTISILVFTSSSSFISCLYDIRKILSGRVRHG